MAKPQKNQTKPKEQEPVVQKNDGIVPETNEEKKEVIDEVTQKVLDLKKAIEIAGKEDEKDEPMMKLAESREVIIAKEDIAKHLVKVASLTKFIDSILHPKE